MYSQYFLVPSIGSLPNAPELHCILPVILYLTINLPFAPKRTLYLPAGKLQYELLSQPSLEHLVHDVTLLICVAIDDTVVQLVALALLVTHFLK